MNKRTYFLHSTFSKPICFLHVFARLELSSPSPPPNLLTLSQFFSYAIHCLPLNPLYQVNFNCPLKNQYFPRKNLLSRLNSYSSNTITPNLLSIPQNPHPKKSIHIPAPFHFTRLLLFFCLCSSNVMDIFLPGQNALLFLQNIPIT